MCTNLYQMGWIGFLNHVNTQETGKKYDQVLISTSPDLAPAHEVPYRTSTLHT